MDASKYQRLTQSLWAPLIPLLAVSILATLAISWWASPKVAELHRNYGEHIAQLAARRAFEPSLEKDLVSLQVIVQDVVDTPTVTNATIHDVENNLLVQAGQRNLGGASSRYLIVTTPITAHDSVTGYIAISVDNSSPFLITAIGTIAVVITLTAMAIIVRLKSGTSSSSSSYHRETNKSSTYSHKTPSIPIVNAAPDPRLEDDGPIDDPAARSIAAREPQVELLIYFHNLRQLHSQLNHSSLRTVTERFEIHLRDVMTLYSGKLAGINADYACLQFSNAAEEEAAFGALCSSNLLLELNKQTSQFQLHFSCLVVPRDSSTKQLRNLPYNLLNFDEWLTLLHNSKPGSLLIENTLLADEYTLQSRCHSEELANNTEISSVLGFSSPYDTLLTKQLSQLRKHTT